MIVFGPIMFVFCLGIFCLIMDTIYPEKDSEIFVVRQKSASEQKSSMISDYDDNNYEEPNYKWDDDSDLIAS